MAARPSSIDGTITHGFGLAQVNLPREEFPFMCKHFPAVTHCEPRTINLHLDVPVDLSEPDYTTPPLHGQTFSFIAIEFEYPIARDRRSGWILIPSLSRNYLGSPHHIEFLTEKVEDLEQRGNRCRVFFRTSAP